MAFNLATFKTRALTAIVFVAVMGFGLLWNYWSFFVLFSIIHFGCWFEFQQLIGRIDPRYLQAGKAHRYGIMIAGWSLMFHFSNGAYSIGAFEWRQLPLWIAPAFLLICPLLDLISGARPRLLNMVYSFLGLLYISLSWGLMMDLRGQGMIWKGGQQYLDFMGFILPGMLIVSIWINDTMAYIVGSLIGKTPLSAISPKKTWEGTIGGGLLCIVLMAVLGWAVARYRLSYWIGIACVAAVAGTLGDLLESKLKRMAGVKDSGSLMPGHGGFLDRFDSLLIATPVAWVLIMFLLQ